MKEMNEEYTRKEKSLILFFETCAVDGLGRVDTRRMNKEDFDIAKAFTENDGYNLAIWNIYLKENFGFDISKFNDKIVNGVGESIGIRIPELRIIAKGISKSENSIEMLEILDKQNLFETRMIEGILIGLMKRINWRLRSRRRFARW